MKKTVLFTLLAIVCGSFILQSKTILTRSFLSSTNEPSQAEMIINESPVISGSIKEEQKTSNEKRVTEIEILEEKIQKLDEEIEILEAQLDTIDLEQEMNSDSTSAERRKEIIHLVNKFTMTMGRLAQLEEQLLNAEVKL